MSALRHRLVAAAMCNSSDTSSSLRFAGDQIIVDLDDTGSAQQEIILSISIEASRMKMV
jgi:hypothetical protein